MSILQPPKIYLDTCHLIRIAQLRKGCLKDDNSADAYRFLDNCIRKWHIGLVFSPQISLEWVDGNATLESGLEIADVVDSAQLQYEVEADHFVFLYEILIELRRIAPDIELPEFEVFYTRILGKEVVRPLGVLANQVPEYFEERELPSDVCELPEAVPFCSVAQCIKQAYSFRHKRQDVYNERVDGHEAAYLRDVAVFSKRKSKNFDRKDMIGWMRRFLRVDRIISSLNPLAEIDSLLKQIEIRNCPAANLFLMAHNQRIRAKIHPHKNDVEDWASVHIVPYVDLMLTERRLCHFILQADNSLNENVMYNPNQAAEFLRKWTE